MDHIIAEEGRESIFAMFACPRYSPDDPRYLSPELRDKLAALRLRQMQEESEARLRILRALPKKRGLDPEEPETE